LVKEEARFDVTEERKDNWWKRTKQQHSRDREDRNGVSNQVILC